MNKFFTYLVGTVLSILIWTVPVTAATAQTPVQRTHSSTTAQVSNLRGYIQIHRSKTWHLEDLAGRGRTPTSYQERKTRSVPCLHWINNLWVKRQVEAKRYLARHRLPYANDWITSVRIVQRDWPGTAGWLSDCSTGEGGHGGWVWNGGKPYSAGGPPLTPGGYRTPPAGSSGAGGPMQYMESTFSGHLAHALASARSLHLALPPPQARRWDSVLGQAFAAGWARRNINTHGPWDPSIDPKCY